MGLGGRVGTQNYQVTKFEEEKDPLTVVDYITNFHDGRFPQIKAEFPNLEVILILFSKETKSQQSYPNTLIWTVYH